MCLHELGLYFSFISCFSFVIFSFVCKKKNAKVGPKIQPIEANFFYWKPSDGTEWTVVCPSLKNQAWSIIMGKNIAS